MTRLTLRLDFATGDALGPGKVRLLELVRDTGSISAAGRAMDMSYRRAWLLIDALNKAFREPVVATQMGGKAGGGAQVTPFGLRVIEDYRAMEREARQVLATRIEGLEQALAKEPATGVSNPS